MKVCNIALIGFRATGKSLIGATLAANLDMAFIDMDEELTAGFEMSIESWVRDRGWEAFRDEESRLLKRLAMRTGVVVATGGGVVLSDSNREILKAHFLVIWLEASSETIYSRLLADPKTQQNRPPLTDLSLKEEIESLMAQREPLYTETANFVVSTDSASPSVISSKILDHVREEQKARDQAG
jgi:shikimate kinase